MFSGTKMWCKHCEKMVEVDRVSEGSTCCLVCGRVLREDLYTNAPTFEKTSNGQFRCTSTMQRMATEFSQSRERTLSKGEDEIRSIVEALSMSGGNSLISPAHRLYKIAVERNFTRGRNTSYTAASCLYIICRQELRPYLLIDFSNYLQINIYVLGSVFLQLCQLLSLEEHPIIQKPIDPSLFMSRFTHCLLGSDNKEVTKTALNIIASMKRDWMQTGRKPSGLCGAALYISVHSHQLRCSKSDIAKTVYVCEATLTKRLIEFENTESANMTAEELDEKANEFITDPCKSNKYGIVELLCQHKDGDQPHYAHGLCRQCYDEFIEISGGLNGGSDPPAFQRAEMQRKLEIEKTHAEEALLSSKLSADEHVLRISSKSQCVGSTGQVNIDISKQHEPFKHKDASNSTIDESENLSDIDDLEVDGYLHTEEEKVYKKIIWEEMNKEYLEELAAKEASEAAAREAYMAQFANCPDDLRSAQELAAAAAEFVAKSRKERKQKRDEEAKSSGPPKTAAEAISRTLKKKIRSSRINYDVLNQTYNIDQEVGKHVESQTDDKYDEHLKESKKEEEASDSKVADDENFYEDDVGEATFYEDDYTGGGYDEDYGDYANEDEYGIF